MYHKRNLAVAISAIFAISALTGCSASNANNIKPTSAVLDREMRDIELQMAAYHLTRTSQPRRVHITSDLEAAAEILGIGRKVQQDQPVIKSAVYKPTPPSIEKKRQTAQTHTQNKTKTKKQQDHGNMWKRIYQGQKMGNYGNHPQVRRFIKSYSNDPARLKRISDRAAHYLFMVIPELERRNMPTELALLPFVESAYVNTAKSHANAAGMWQFIPSTGRDYGLKQTKGYDGRMDSFEATRAALDYLQKLNREFNGDWFLSLAAYNAGEGRVGRAIAKNRRKGLPTDYWSIRLPRETREYVPRLLAYKEIIRTPERYGLRLPVATSRARLIPVHINKAVDLRKVAQRAGLPKLTLTSLNPSYLQGVTTPRLSKRIILPARHAGRLRHILKKMPSVRDANFRYVKRALKKRYTKKRYSKSYKKTYKSKGKRIITHRVRSGETLFRIALRHGTTVKSIMRMNKLRSSKVLTGKRLRVASKKYSKYYS